MKEVIKGLDTLYGQIMDHNLRFKTLVESGDLQYLDLFTLEKVLAENPDKKLVYETPTLAKIESMEYTLAPFDYPTNFTFYVPVKSLKIIDDYILLSFREVIDTESLSFSLIADRDDIYYKPDHLLEKLQTLRFRGKIDRSSPTLLQVIDKGELNPSAWSEEQEKSRVVNIFSGTTITSNCMLSSRNNFFYLNAHY